MTQKSISELIQLLVFKKKDFYYSLEYTITPINNTVKCVQNHVCLNVTNY